MKDPINTTAAPFDAFSIVTSDWNAMPLTHQVPPGYEKYVIPGSHLYSAAGDPGIMLFQELPYPQYTFWISNYFTKTKAKVTGELPEPSLEIHFILQNALIYKLNGFGWQSIRETQYNLLAIPVIKNEVYFDARDYFTFDIHPSLPFLEKSSPNDPLLKNFLNQARGGHFVQFFETHPYASPKMLHLIKQILVHLQGGDEVLPDLDQTVAQLIKLALTKPSLGEHLHFSFFDVEKIYQAERLMVQHMDDEDILERQMENAYLRKSRFREGFLQIFGELPHVYLHRRRLEKARFLLQSYPDLKIRDIAREVGYPNPDNFSTIYKNFFGIAPGKDRKDSLQ